MPLYRTKPSGQAPKRQKNYCCVIRADVIFFIFFKIICTCMYHHTCDVVYHEIGNHVKIRWGVVYCFWSSKHFCCFSIKSKAVIFLIKLILNQEPRSKFAYSPDCAEQWLISPMTKTHNDLHIVIVIFLISRLCSAGRYNIQIWDRYRFKGSTQMFTSPIKCLIFLYIE